MKTMKKVVPLFALLFAGTVLLAAIASPTRYLHVRVISNNKQESVRVNVPLTLAESVIPAINHGKLHNGKIECNGFHNNDVDIKAILQALKTAPEGEFVTVQETNNDVRVAKEHGNLVVHVVDKNKQGKGKENVDVTIPWSVAQALASDTNDNELNIAAAIKALENAGDVTLVAVTDNNETVKIWVDSNSGSAD
jgi:ribonuclease HI